MYSFRYHFISFFLLKKGRFTVDFCNKKLDRFKALKTIKEKKKEAKRAFKKIGVRCWQVNQSKHTPHSSDYRVYINLESEIKRLHVMSILIHQTRPETNKRVILLEGDIRGMPTRGHWLIMPPQRKEKVPFNCLEEKDSRKWAVCDSQKVVLSKPLLSNTLNNTCSHLSTLKHLAQISFHLDVDGDFFERRRCSSALLSRFIIGWFGA